MYRMVDDKKMNDGEAKPRSQNSSESMSKSSACCHPVESYKTEIVHQSRHHRSR